MKKTIVKIERMGSDGEGIAYIDNNPVFIYYTLIGEVVEINLFKNKRGAFEGELLNVIEPSPIREEVLWKYYMKSGSLNLLHLTYFEQLKYKRNVINFLLSSKIRRITNKTKVELTIGSKETINYRNKTDIPLLYMKGKNALANYYRGSNNLFPIDELVAEDKNIISALDSILKVLDEFNIKAYNFKNKKGEVYSVSVRVNLEGKAQVMLNVSRELNLKDFSTKLIETNNNIISIYQNVITRYRSNVDTYNGTLSLVGGFKYLEMKLNNLKFYLTPLSFFQLNTNQSIVLYEKIIELANFKKTDTVLDAYSGVGTIASFISSHVKEVVAVETIKDATLDMEYSLRRNNIDNVTVITGDLVKMTNYLNRKFKFDKVLFDPPRTGLGKDVCNYLLKTLPKEIIYVSCNPKTLVEDLETLSKKYTVISITPIDMFPQTSQIESITILKLR